MDAGSAWVSALVLNDINLVQSSPGFWSKIWCEGEKWLNLGALYLGKIYLDDESFEFIESVIQHPKSKLDTIWLKDLRNMSAGYKFRLYQSIKSNVTCLSHFYLEDFNMAEENLCTLYCQTLENSNTLRTVVLKNCQVNPGALKKNFKSAMLGLKYLNFFTFKGIQSDNLDWTLIVQACIENMRISELFHLDLGQNAIKLDNLTPLMRFLRETIKSYDLLITTIHLGENDFTAQEVQGLLQAEGVLCPLPKFQFGKVLADTYFDYFGGSWNKAVYKSVYKRGIIEIDYSDKAEKNRLEDPSEFLTHSATGEGHEFDIGSLVQKDS